MSDRAGGRAPARVPAARRRVGMGVTFAMADGKDGLLVNRVKDPGPAVGVLARGDRIMEARPRPRRPGPPRARAARRRASMGARHSRNHFHFSQPLSLLSCLCLPCWRRGAPG